MILSAIAAMAENYTIGVNNQLPWHLPADLKHFKATTSGSPILMGRKTFESIGRPLPNRTNVIITRDKNFKVDGCLVANSITDAISLAGQHATDEVFVIGGAEIYKQALPSVNKLYLTIVHQYFDGDAHFPALMPGEWREITRERHTATIDNPHEYSFITMERVAQPVDKKHIGIDELVTLK